jgi:hypothetical protein
MNRLSALSLDMMIPNARVGTTTVAGRQWGHYFLLGNFNAPQEPTASARLQRAGIRWIIIGLPSSSSMRARGCGEISPQMQIGFLGGALVRGNGQDFAERGKRLTNRGVYM